MAACAGVFATVFASGADAALFCQGKRATKVGTARANTITGTPRADVIVGLGGNDRIFGLGGNDRICGGTGHDLVRGGPGNDILSGGSGDDTLFGEAGADSLKGEGGTYDLADGGAGNDLLSGGAGPWDIVAFWYLRGNVLGGPVNASLAAGSATGQGADRLNGFEQLAGSVYNDTLTSRASGFTSLAGIAGNDLLQSGGDFAFADFSWDPAGATAALGEGSAPGAAADGWGGTDTLVNLSGLYGTEYADNLTGNSGPNEIYAWRGNDQISGLAGDDFLDGEENSDNVNGGADSDICLNAETSAECEEFTYPRRAALAERGIRAPRDPNRLARLVALR